ncbi:MFS transporter [Comamonas serinivorans]|uniref:MFS transporter n=1 Tax=Comamonas serinivorans TaxID=1082851 RepID=A0A1Y0ES03_9BURK|nr:MFS transporter [Comamonas serinivorans]ARU06356.1 MFS transporter [Comamonas serinivorans]
MSLPQTQPPHPPTGVWGTLTITLAIQSMVAMALLSLPVIASEVAPQLGVAVSWVGGYVALAYVAAMLSSLGSGALVKRFGAIRASQLGLLACAAGLALSAVPHVGVMALGALAVGMGYGPITPASSHLLAQSTPPHRMALVFSLKQTGVPLGGLLAGASVPGLSLWLGWSGALLAVAAVSVVLAGVAQPLRAALDADRQPHARLGGAALSEPVRLVLGEPTLARLAACSFVFSATQLALTAYLSTFLTHDLGVGLVLAGLWLSWAQTGGVLGRVAWGYVADRWLGPRWTLIGLALLMAACALATANLQMSWPLWAIGVLLVAFGASAVGWNGVYLSEVARQAPTGLASMATGGTLAITFMGNVFGPTAFGWLGAQVGHFRLGYALLAAPILVCALLLWRTPALGGLARRGGS